MKADAAGKKQEPGHVPTSEAAPKVPGGRERDRDRAPAPIDDSMLRNYLTDALGPEDSARADGQLHTLGAIWHRARLTCPSRQQLGSFLLDALDPELAAYLQFHLDVVECPFCQANLDDLKAQSQATHAAKASKSRQHRILQSSQHLLGEDKR
jgi:hypothetical protein